MTESEWLAATDPMPMLEFLRSKASDRKLRLLGVVIARESWNELLDDRSRRAVEVAEEFADGVANASELETASDAACDARDEQWDSWPRNDKQLDMSEVAYATASLSMREKFNRPLVDYPFWRPLPAHCHLIREIFGNSLRPVAFDPEWRTSTVVSIARMMYENRDFSPMPLLADAFQDAAGCEHEGILNHCRGNGPHVRGCWVVDLILGKE